MTDFIDWYNKHVSLHKRREERYFSDNDHPTVPHFSSLNGEVGTMVGGGP